MPCYTRGTCTVCRLSVPTTQQMVRPTKCLAAHTAFERLLSCVYSAMFIVRSPCPVNRLLQTVGAYISTVSLQCEKFPAEYQKRRLLRKKLLWQTSNWNGFSPDSSFATTNKYLLYCYDNEAIIQWKLVTAQFWCPVI